MSAIDLRFGEWQAALADVSEVQTLIVDAPYSERTHSSHNAGADDANTAARPEIKGNVTRQRLGLDPMRRSITYSHWTATEIEEFCTAWSGRTRGWFVTITDHILGPIWSNVLEGFGRYVFAPIPFVETGSRVRLTGDGPSSWTAWVIAARPCTREFQRWGTLPGAYIARNERKPVVGGKPLGLMRALVRDYSRIGDLICDPCAGGATTLIAAATEGRRAIGAEMDRSHYEIAMRRIARGYTPSLFEEIEYDDWTDLSEEAEP